MRFLSDGKAGVSCLLLGLFCVLQLLFVIIIPSMVKTDNWIIC